MNRFYYHWKMFEKKTGMLLSKFEMHGSRHQVKRMRKSQVKNWSGVYNGGISLSKLKKA